MKKRWIALFLACLMCVSLVPTTAFAAATEVASGTCGTNLTWVLDSDGLLTISGTGEMDNYNGESWKGTNDIPWSDYFNSIQAVVIEEGVTSIGKRSFMCCNNLKSVAIPDGLLSIGIDAFWECTSLTDVVLSDSVESVGDFAFAHCTALERFRIGNGLSEIGFCVFGYSTNLKTIDVDKNNSCFSSVDGVLFGDGKTKLICYPAGKEDTYYRVPGYVTDIESSAFGECYNLCSVVVGNNVLSVGGSCFQNCTNLKTITLGKNISTIADYFVYGCSSLTDIYYAGTEAQWNVVVSEEDRNELSSVNVCYNWVIEEDVGPTITVSNPSGVVGERFDFTVTFDALPESAYLQIDGSTNVLGWISEKLCSVNPACMIDLGSLTEQDGKYICNKSMTIYSSGDASEDYNRHIRVVYKTADGETKYSEACQFRVLPKEQLTNGLEVRVDTTDSMASIGDSFTFDGKVVNTLGEIEAIQIDISRLSEKSNDYSEGVDYYRIENCGSEFDLSSITPTTFQWGDILNAREGHTSHDTSLDTSVTGQYRIKLWIKPDNGETVSFEKKIVVAAEEETDQVRLATTSGASDYERGQCIPLVAEYSGDGEYAVFLVTTQPGASSISFSEKIVPKNQKFQYNWDTEHLSLGTYYVCVAVYDKDAKEVKRSNYFPITIVEEGTLANRLGIYAELYPPHEDGSIVKGDKVNLNFAVSVATRGEFGDSIEKITILWVDSKEQNSKTLFSKNFAQEEVSQYSDEIELDTLVYNGGCIKVYAKSYQSQTAEMKKLSFNLTRQIELFESDEGYAMVEDGDTLKQDVCYALCMPTCQSDSPYEKITYILSTGIMDQNGNVDGVVYRIDSKEKNNYFIAYLWPNQIQNGTYYLNSEANDGNKFIDNLCFHVENWGTGNYSVRVDGQHVTDRGEVQVSLNEDSFGISINTKEYTDLNGVAFSGKNGLKSASVMMNFSGTEISMNQIEGGYTVIIPLSDVAAAWGSAISNKQSLGFSVVQTFEEGETKSISFNINFRDISKEIQNNLSVIQEYEEKAYDAIDALDCDDTEKAGRRNIIKKAFSMAKFVWTPLEDTYYWGWYKSDGSYCGSEDKNRIFKKGSFYYGIPYTMDNRSWSYPYGTANGIDLRYFDVEKIKECGQYTYKDSGGYYELNEGFSGNYAGNDCSAFVSQCLKIGNLLTYGIMDSPLVYSMGSASDTAILKSMRPGDIFVKSSHTIMFLAYDGDKVTVIEQGGNCGHNYKSDSRLNFYVERLSTVNVGYYTYTDISSYTAYRLTSFSNLQNSAVPLSSCNDVELLESDKKNETTYQNEGEIDSGYVDIGYCCVKQNEVDSYLKLYRTYEYDNETKTPVAKYKTVYGETVIVVYDEVDGEYVPHYEVLDKEDEELYTTDGERVLFYREMNQGDVSEQYVTEDGTPVSLQTQVGINGDYILSYVKDGDEPQSEGDFSVESCTAYFHDESIDFSLSVNNETGTRQGVILFAGVYDKNGKMIQVEKLDTVTFSVGNTEIQESLLLDNESDGCTYKIFFLDSEEYKPLTDACFGTIM